MSSLVKPGDPSRSSVAARAGGAGALLASLHPVADRDAHIGIEIAEPGLERLRQPHALRGIALVAVPVPLDRDAVELERHVLLAVIDIALAAIVIGRRELLGRGVHRQAEQQRDTEEPRTHHRSPTCVSVKVSRVKLSFKTPVFPSRRVSWRPQRTRS
jgi:hypothetical protein